MGIPERNSILIEFPSEVRTGGRRLPQKTPCRRTSSLGIFEETERLSYSQSCCNRGIHCYIQTNEKSNFFSNFSKIYHEKFLYFSKITTFKKNISKNGIFRATPENFCQILSFYLSSSNIREVPLRSWVLSLVLSLSLPHHVKPI